MESGEKRGTRDTKDMLIRDQVESGIRPEKAEQKAIWALREADRRKEGKQ